MNSLGPRALRIQDLLATALAPEVLLIEDESHMHSGSRVETHFKVLVVSALFEGLSRVDRQRRVNEILADELKSGLHALTQRALTPKEWATQGSAADFISPACLGGGKKPSYKLFVFKLTDFIFEILEKALHFVKLLFLGGYFGGHFFRKYFPSI